MKLNRCYLLLLILILGMNLFAQSPPKNILWGDDVPAGWNSDWPEKFLTVPEKTDYTRTTSSSEIHEFIEMLKWNSENVHVFSMFISDLRKVCPAVLLSNPRVSSPKEAKESGKPVIYLQGNIHPPEAEGKEALLMVMRDILFGDKKHLLDDQIIIVCPNFNVDGNDTWSTKNGTPHIIGTRRNGLNYDVNRDGIKVETTNVKGLYETVLKRWDPVLFFDAHAMGRVKHAYANCYATCTVPAAHPEPRNYVWDKLFPSVRKSVRKNFQLEMFSHCLFDEDNWPPTMWSHDNAYWTTEGKFVTSAYGLRNRMSILVETPGYPAFERKIYAQYAFIMELLEYTNVHGNEMVKICHEADEAIVQQIKEKAATGSLKNYVEGDYESRGKIDILAYPKNETETIPGTSVLRSIPGQADGPPVVCKNVSDLTKPVGIKEATVPRGYLIPAYLIDVIEKLEILGIQYEVLNDTMTVSGEEFVVDQFHPIQKNGYDMTRLEGGFFRSPRKVFPSGTYKVDMAQPLANLIFYCLEPEVGDGFTGWGFMDEHLKSLGAGEHSVVYPIFKYLTILEK